MDMRAVFMDETSYANINKIAKKQLQKIIGCGIIKTK